jgi:chemotaxis signal transduction protein/nucleoid-associated protein YgaU
MRELLVIHAGCGHYGIWKDNVLSVKDVQTLHRLPLFPACIAGISIIDDRTVTLADLAVCIGFAPGDGSEKGRILILSGQEKTTAFLVAGDIDSLSISPEAIVPLPEYVRTDVIHSCSIHDGLPVPIIDVSLLYSRILKFDQDPPGPSCTVPRTESPDSAAPSILRIFSLGDELYALSSSGVEEKSITPVRVAEIPRVPKFVKGIACHEGGILPVIDLSQRIQRQKIGSGDKMLIQKISGVRFGLLIGEDRGTVQSSEFKIASLPSTAGSSWLKYAVLTAGQIVPLVDPVVLLSINAEVGEEQRREVLHTTDSEFPILFKKQDVEVVEFFLLSVRHALPKSEVEDVIDFKPYREIPDAPPIVVGVAEHDGLLLPVLDLALVFGRRSLVAPGWRMMLVKNGDFRALVITESVFGERRLPLDIQRSVPIRLPRRVVYGCYPDADAVRLILNVEAMAVHFEKSLVRELLPSMPSEMKRAAAEIVTSLLDDQTTAALASEAVKQSGPVPGYPEAETPVMAMAGAVGLIQQIDAKAEATSDVIQTEREQEEEIEAKEEETRIDKPVLQSEEEGKSAILQRGVVDSDAGAGAVPAGLVETETTAEVQGKTDFEQSEEPAVVSEVKIEEKMVKAEEISPERDVAVAADPSEEARPEETSVKSGLAAETPQDVSSSLMLKEDERESESVSESQLEQKPGREPKSDIESEPVLEPKSALEPELAREYESATPMETSVKSGLAAETPQDVSSPLTPKEDESETVSAAGSQLELEPALKPKPALEPEPAAPEVPVSGEFETQISVDDQESWREPASRLLEQGASRLEQPVIKGAKTHQFAPSDKIIWKRRIGFGAIAAILAGTIYVVGISYQPATDKPVKKTTPSKIEQVKAEPKAPPLKKQEPTLVLEIPATTTMNIDGYIVVKGDTLWHISERFTGNPFNYPHIAGENRIADPDLIFPGQKIYFGKKQNAPANPE